jgi:hypothetical protein
MHTKTLVGVGVMGLLGVLALFALSARLAAVPESVVKTESEVVPTEEVSQSETVTASTTTIVNAPKPTTPDRMDEPVTERRGLPETEVETLVGEEKFVGKLEEVNVGCFADGECYVVVDGKHVTVMMGWTNATVGSVLGVEGFGDLEYFIGEEVSVYAGKKSDGTYTLYQKAGYFVKLESAAGASVVLGKSLVIGGLAITPKKIIEDSRCPMGVVCIQAGTVKVEATVAKAGKNESVVFELGQTQTVFDQKITLLRVDPQKEVDNNRYVI